MANNLAKSPLNNGNPKCPKAYGNPSEEDSLKALSYIAGYVDADGSILIARSKARNNWMDYFRPKLVITSTSLVPLNYALKMFPEGSIYTKPVVKKRTKPCYEFIIEGPRAYRMLQAIKPFLLLKKKQAALAIGFYRACFIKRPGIKDESGSFPKTECYRREKFWKKSKELNRQ